MNPHTSTCWKEWNDTKKVARHSCGDELALEEKKEDGQNAVFAYLV